MTNQSTKRPESPGFAACPSALYGSKDLCLRCAPSHGVLRHETLLWKKHSVPKAMREAICIHIGQAGELGFVLLVVDIFAAPWPRCPHFAFEASKPDSSSRVPYWSFSHAHWHKNTFVVDIDHVVYFKDLSFVPVTYVLFTIASASALYVVDLGTSKTTRACLLLTTWLTAFIHQSANSFNS